MTVLVELLFIVLEYFFEIVQIADPLRALWLLKHYGMTLHSKCDTRLLYVAWSTLCQHMWPGLQKYGMWALKIFLLLVLITFYSNMVQPKNFLGLLIIYLALQHCLQNSNTIFSIEICLIKWHGIFYSTCPIFTGPVTYWHLVSPRRVKAQLTILALKPLLA